METKLSIVILSHLNDAKIEVGTLDRETIRRAITRLDFINYLVLNHVDKSTEIDPDKEYEKFLQFRANRRS